MLRPKLVINLAHLKFNYKQVCNRATPVECAAILKCDAYGLGVKEIALALREVDCRTFFVTDVAEGIVLRSILVDRNIIVLNGPEKSTLDLMQKNKLIPAVSTLEQLNLCKNINIAINLDCGFNRIGLRMQDLRALHNKLLYRKPIKLIMSHLACANDKNNYLNLLQLEKFKEMLKFFPSSAISLSASNGFFLGEEYKFNLIRVGSALFGLNTLLNQNHCFKPVVNLYAPIVQIATIKKGDCVGYGATFQADKNMRIAVLAIGFGDGLSRNLSNKGFVWFKGNKKYFPCPIIGAISMDYTVCDISNVPESIIYPGKNVSFLNEFYTINDMASVIDAVGCAEVFTSIGNGKRYIRQWID